jgi:hypothetical protein
MDSLNINKRTCWSICVSPIGSTNAFPRQRKIIGGCHFLHSPWSFKGRISQFSFLQLAHSFIIIQCALSGSVKSLFLFLIFSVESSKLLLAFVSAIVLNLRPRPITALLLFFQDIYVYWSRALWMTLLSLPLILSNNHFDWMTRSTATVWFCLFCLLLLYQLQSDEEPYATGRKECGGLVQAGSCDT